MSGHSPHVWLLQKHWLIVVALLSLAFTGCPLLHSLEERLGECHDTTVELLNSQQSVPAVHILVNDELATPETRLESGQARHVTLCLERGRGYRFRAESDIGPLASVRCPSSVTRYEAETPSVVWTPVGFDCVDW